MNAYTTTTQARIRQRDIANVIRFHPFGAGAHLAALERQRGHLVEAELHSLLKQHGVTPHSVTATFAPLRQAIGAALVRIGLRVQGASQSNGAPDTTVTAGTLGVAR